MDVWHLFLLIFFYPLRELLLTSSRTRKKVKLPTIYMNNKHRNPRQWEAKRITQTTGGGVGESLQKLKPCTAVNFVSFVLLIC